MSQNIRATAFSSSGRQGIRAKVEGSGMAIMSDSSIGLKPVIEEPSKPMPPSKASSSSDGVDREALQLAEHVGEPEADEADVVLLDDLDDVSGTLRLVCHSGLLGWLVRERRATIGE